MEGHATEQNHRLSLNYTEDENKKNSKHPHHDFPQLVTFWTDVVHQHLVGCELVLYG